MTTNQFKKGDKVVSKDGVKFVVLTHNEGSPAVHVETAEGVEPYARTWYAAEALKLQGKRTTPAKEQEPPHDPPAGDAGDPNAPDPNAG